MRAQLRMVQSRVPATIWTALGLAAVLAIAPGAWLGAQTPAIHDPALVAAKPVLEAGGAASGAIAKLMPAATGPASAAVMAKPAPVPAAVRPAPEAKRVGADSAAAMAAPVSLELETHHSLLVRSPQPLTQVSVADNAIAEVTVVSPYQVLVQGKAPGDVSMLLWDAKQHVHPYTVRVRLDPAPLQQVLAGLFPEHTPRVTASGGALVLSGVLPDKATAQRALEVAAGFSSKVVNDLKLDAAPDPPQVLLQVRFAEVNRSAVSQLGANLISTGKGLVGSVGTQQFGPPTGAVAPSSSQIPQGTTNLGGNGGTFGLNDLLNVFLFNRSADIGLTLKALEQKSLLQILAEPNLLAMDGKQASFLAGGEFPFPVVQGQGAVNSVTIQFKPFGVNLHFTPTVLSDGTIDLKVAPEVSALDFSNGLTVSGFRIPALSTRRAETELELSDGQSFVIAGLMDNRLSQSMAKIPGLGDIPILGEFFRSHDNNRSRDELMVVVTAHLVQPSAVVPKLPAMPVPFINPAKFDGKDKG